MLMKRPAHTVIAYSIYIPIITRQHLPSEICTLRSPFFCTTPTSPQEWKHYWSDLVAKWMPIVEEQWVHSSTVTQLIQRNAVSERIAPLVIATVHHNIYYYP